jgi:hypothetical protein
MMLTVSIVYGLWAVWASVTVLRDAHFAAGDRGRLSFLIAIRDCGSSDLISRKCASIIRDTIASIDEPSIWTALWRMRLSYAEFIIVPPAWLVAVVGLGAAIWCLVVLRQRRRGAVVARPTGVALGRRSGSAIRHSCGIVGKAYARTSGPDKM